ASATRRVSRRVIRRSGPAFSCRTARRCWRRCACTLIASGRSARPWNGGTSRRSMICWPQQRRGGVLWEVEIRPEQQDPERQRVCAEYDLLTGSRNGTAPVVASARGYLLEGNLAREDAQRLVDELLLDPLVETARLRDLGLPGAEHALTVLLKPGVMDPA